MSTVKLTAFAGFKKGPKTAPGIEVLFGAADARLGATGNYELLLSSVPLARNLRAPADGLLMLYGLRDSAEELQLRRAEVRAAGGSFQFAELEAEVGTIVTGIIDHEALKHCRFANIKRMSAELQQEIVDTFVEYVAEEGGDPSLEMNRLKAIARRPDLFGRLLAEHKAFKKVEVMIIPVIEGDKMRQIAYVRPNCKYVQFSQSTDDDVLVLPLHFGKKVSLSEA